MMRLILILISFWLVGCIEKISLELPDAEVALKVMQGYVERDSNYYVFWGKTALANDIKESAETGDLGANISFEFNDEVLIPVQSGQKLKMPIAEFHDRYGGNTDDARFRMLVDIGGDRYSSELQKIVKVPRADSLSVSLESRAELSQAGFIVTRRYVQLYAHSPLANEDGERTSLSWEVSATFQFREGIRSDPLYEPKTCYSTFNEFTNNINIAGTQDYSEDKVHLKIGETRNDYRFGIACYFNVVQKSISQDVVEFWKEVKSSNERAGTFYDVFPGSIRSNFENENNPSEQILGYFYTSEVDTVRLKVNPDMVDFPLQRCINWEEPEIIYPFDTDPCLDCLNLTRSTTVRPKYWRGT